MPTNPDLSQADAPRPQETCPAADRPPAQADLTRRQVAVGLCLCLAVAGALLAKQITDLKVASRDATAYYLPLAHSAAVGDWGHAQHLVIPPVYGVLTGRVSRLFRLVPTPDMLAAAGQAVSAVSLLAVILLVYAIGSFAWNRRVGLIAAGLACCNPWMVRFGAQVGPEMLYSAVLTATVYLLLRYLARPNWPWLLAASASAALAPLVRSEGLYLPLIAGAVIVLVQWRACPRRLGLLAGHVLALAAVSLAVWWPRIAYVQACTGFAVLDLRMIHMFPGGLDAVDPHHWIPPGSMGYVRFESAFLPRPWTEIFDELQESLMMVIGPVTWTLAIVWWCVRSRLDRNRPAQRVLLAVLLAQVAVVVSIKVDRRYVVSVAALVQVGGALGLLALCEWVARRWKLTLRPHAPWVLLAVLIAGHAGWSLLMSNRTLRHAELRRLGLQMGPVAAEGRLPQTAVFLASSPEIPYYAGQLWLSVQDPSSVEGLTLAQLAHFCRTSPYRIDYVVVRSRERWCPELTQAAENGKLPPGSVVMEDSTSRNSSWVLDSRKLFAAVPQTPPVQTGDYKTLMRTTQISQIPK